MSARRGELGVTVFDLSSAGIGAYHGPSRPGFQVPRAAAVREALEGTDSFVTAVGLLTDPAQAEHVVVTGQADGVSVGRAALKDAHWPANAAKVLGVARDGGTHVPTSNGAPPGSRTALRRRGATPPVGAPPPSYLMCWGGRGAY
ncbi:hypothetical protein [Arthrobacter sp.]|uniref:hypothetical protein n=1 Tax=Arthrobacter sp. TaxID=1667 RepID=UPI00339AF19F